MKKVITLFFILMLFPLLSVNAMEKAKIPPFDVTFNGQLVESKYRQFPLITYKDITYVSMTYYDCRFLGLSTSWNDSTKTLYIDRTPVTCAYRDYNWQWKNSESNDASICEFNIVVNGKEIDNSKEEYPLLTFRDVTYFPLTWRFAVDEFGWDYSFDEKTGLCIFSKNYHTQTLNLPDMQVAVATDGSYYYYSGDKDGKKVVFRTSLSNPENPEVIHEQIESPLTQYASFINSLGDIYFTYFAGYSGVTGAQRFFKIEADGTVTEKTPDTNYSYGKHGYHELKVTNGNIKVTGVHHGVDGKTEFSYEKDGNVYDILPLPGWVRVGEKRNGILISEVNADSVEIFENKIYYTAMDYETKEDSALYVIDTLTGENKKIIDGVCGFHVYKGKGGTEIIYDNKGLLMCYNELTGEKLPIEKEADSDLFLVKATGTNSVYAVLKNAAGNKTVLKKISSDKASSDILFKTKTGTVVSKSDDKLCLRVSGESPEDEIRLFVAGDDITPFFSADSAKSVFIYENTMLYKTDKATLIRVDLR